MADEIQNKGVTLQSLAKLGAGHALNVCREQCVNRPGVTPFVKEVINAGFKGLGEVITTAITESSIPDSAMGPVELARHAGILKPNRARKKGDRGPML